MNILSLDLGTTTGWSLRTGTEIRAGSQSFKPNRFDGGGMRYLRFSSWLTELVMLVPGGFQLVVFEEVRNHAGVDAAHAYGGFMATLTSWCEHRKIPYQGVPVGTIKSSWSGKGNASKDAMIRICRERGFAPVDDNEADAIALLHWAMHEHKAAPTSRERRAPASRERRAPASRERRAPTRAR